jgi:hypothetical protein
MVETCGIGGKREAAASANWRHQSAAKEKSNMNLEYYHQRRLIVRGLALALGLNVVAFSARANVYATNLKLNGSVTNVVAIQGDGVSISFLLNEPATLGTTVNIRAGTNVVRSLSCADGSPGALRGLNTVVWDGKDRDSNTVAPGAYAVSVTASSSHTDWTQITSDADDPNTYVFEGHGIAADQNPSSPYYGRIFVANSANNGSETDPPNVAGVLKFNADTSGAEEGISSAGLDGHDWAGNFVSPWKIAVSADDDVYVSDLASGGEVYRWDPTISSNSLLYVLRTDNQPPGATLTGPAIFGVGTNAEVWMANTSATEGALLRWRLATNGACASNDLGVAIVGIGTNLSSAPSAIALDKAGNIYACVAVTSLGSPVQRVFRFPAYDPSTNGSLVETNADWAVGAGDDTYCGASGIAVDPTGAYVAVSFEGIFPDNGNTKIFSATNGALITSLDLGDGFSIHVDTACGWDAVGNVYYIDNYFGRWRAVSPPGTNHATTAALGLVQVVAPPIYPPYISSVETTNGTVTIEFIASPYDTPADFAVVGAAEVLGPYTVVSNAVITNQIGAGEFRATLPKDGPMQYYRIKRLEAIPQTPQITRLGVSNGTVTLNFTGAATDSFTAFTLLSASSPAGPYSVAQGGVIGQVSPGVFRATVPVNGPVQFYRIQR